MCWKRSKKLPAHARSTHSPSAQQPADRGLVSGQGAARPEERPDPDLGAQGLATQAAGRPTLRQRLSLRRHLPPPRHRSRPGVASRQQRCNAAASRRDQPRRGASAHAVVLIDRAGLASLRQSEASQDPLNHPAAATFARAEPGGEHLEVPPPEPAVEPRLRQL